MFSDPNSYLYSDPHSQVTRCNDDSDTCWKYGGEQSDNRATGRAEIRQTPVNKQQEQLMISTCVHIYLMWTA